MSADTISVFEEHLQGTGLSYTSESATDCDKRLMAVKCALDLIASYGPSGKVYLHQQMDSLSDYADLIQTALEVKDKE